MDEGQTMRYSKRELRLMKATFADNPLVLQAIRKVFYQFKLEDEEHKTVDNLSQEVLTLIRKGFIPELTSDVPLLQMADMYLSLATIKELNPAVASLHINAKDIEVEYLTQRFDILGGVKANQFEEISLLGLREKGDKNEEQRFTEMMAYLSLSSYIDNILLVFKNLAGKKDETPEETLKRLQQDSNK
jgi:hypothetical protein|tara:strand:- start:6014 stop:6577 length:564 start_codon:yes stop_codon:yes gene_type:complete